MHLSHAALFVTTRKSPSEADVADARALAARHDLPFAPRSGRSIAHHVRDTGRPAALVVKADAIHLVTAEARYGFHPNMAARRVDGRGLQGDHFLRSAMIGPGDHVLDCTCGMGADAITAAHAVGPSGRVVALEAAPILGEIVSRGLARHDKGPPALIAAMRRVEHVTADARAFLATLPDRSFDVVAFDPMFARPRAGGHGLDLVRAFAVDAVPDRALLDAALRVARRCVVMADGTPGPRLAALSIPVVSRDRRKWWGRLDVPE